MNRTIQRILFPAIAAAILLAACAPAAAPTQDPALIQQQINQAVEATVAAQNAAATAQQALIVPSNTPLPTQTEAAAPSPTPLLPTATPFVIIPPTNTAVVSSGSGSVTTVKPDYACDAINRRPYDNTVIKPNDPFDIKWTIVNTGTKTWRAGLDLKYFSGPKMSSTTPIELPAMKPGDKYQVIMDAQAPATLGFHVMTWTVEGQICYPYVAIIVDKP